MPFQINLDACVLRSVQDYPFILGNLMMNDYIRGLCPLKQDKRIHPQKYLSMFNDNLTNRQRERHPAIDRTITQISCNVQGHASDPRGAGLEYSRWLCKWYVGLGRIRNIFEGVFANIGRMKILLAEEGFDHSSIFSQKVEESIIRSFVRCLLPDSNSGADEAVEWYREALPHNKTHCLELCMDEHLFPQMGVDSLAWQDPGTHVNPGGQTVPHFMQDTFCDNHPAVLAMCFGEGHGNTMAEQSIGRCCQRVIEQSLATLQNHAKGSTTGGKFNLQRTFIDFADGESLYSAVVCSRSYFKIDVSEFRPVQPSLAALNGIALVMPQKDFTSGTARENGRLYDCMLRSGLQKSFKWLIGVRTDLYRCLDLHGFAGINNFRAFAVSYSEVQDHDGALAQCTHPARNMGTTRMFSFWPHNNPKLDRGPVPRECVEGIHMINQALLTFEARAMDVGVLRYLNTVADPFKSIAAPHDTKLNQKAPALKTPLAVRAVDVEKAAVIDLAPQQHEEPTEAMVLEVSAASRIRELEEAVDAQRAKQLEWADRGNPPKRQRTGMEFFDDSHGDDPDEAGTGTQIHSQTWVWGALILLVLVVVTFRHRF